MYATKHISAHYSAHQQHKTVLFSTSCRPLTVPSAAPTPTTGIEHFEKLDSRTNIARCAANLDWLRRNTPRGPQELLYCYRSGLDLFGVARAPRRMYQERFTDSSTGDFRLPHFIGKFMRNTLHHIYSTVKRVGASLLAEFVAAGDLFGAPKPCLNGRKSIEVLHNLTFGTLKTPRRSKDVLKKIRRPKPHTGSHSITRSNVTATNIFAHPETIKPNAVETLVGMLQSDTEHVTRLLNQVQINTALTGPTHVNNARIDTVTTQFVRWTPAGNNPLPTNVTFTASKRVDVLPVADIDSFMLGGSLQPKKVADALTSTGGWTRNAAERVAPLLADFLHRTDVSALFVVAFLLYFQLRDFELAGVVPNIAAALADDVSFRVTNPGAAQLEAEMAGLMADMQAGKLIMKRENLSDGEVAALRLLSAGPSHVTAVPVPVGLLPAPPAAQQHVASSINTPMMQFSLLCAAGNNVAPALANVTSAHMLSLIRKMHVQLNDAQALVTGFTRASTLLNPIESPVAAPAHRLFFATLETCAITLPAPQFHNFMWRSLGLEKARAGNPLFASESEVIRSLSPMVLDKVCPSLAFAISIGFSSVLNLLNLSGRELNSYRSVAPAHARQTLADLLPSLGAGANSYFSALGTSFISLISTIVINPLTLGTTSWNGDMASIPQGAFIPQDLWQGTWGHHIPYHADPLAGSFMFDSWADIWGIGAPDITFDFYEDCTHFGGVLDRLWLGQKGEKDYNTIATSDTPYLYVPYGLAALNVIRQETGWIAGVFVVQYQMWDATTGHLFQRGTDVAVANQPVLMLPATLNYIKPGTLLTYDWVLKQARMPGMTFGVMTAARWAQLTHKATHVSFRAGIYLPGVVRLDTGAEDNRGLARLLANTHLGTANVDPAHANPINQAAGNASGAV